MRCLVNPLSALTSSCLGLRYALGLQTLQHTTYLPCSFASEENEYQEKLFSTNWNDTFAQSPARSTRLLTCSNSCAGLDSLRPDCQGWASYSLSEKCSNTAFCTFRYALLLYFLTQNNRMHPLHCINRQINDFWCWLQFGEFVAASQTDNSQQGTLIIEIVWGANQRPQATQKSHWVCHIHFAKIFECCQ